jgi:branched-chain amino acid transport system permease protein
MTSTFFRPERLGLLVLVSVMFILPIVFSGNQLFFNVANNVGIRALLCLGLSLLLGFAGQISLGHAGFFAIGAYGSALLTAKAGLPALAAVVGAAAVAGVIAWIIGRSILRLSGHLLAMATLAMGSMIYIVLNQQVDWFGGPDGISVMPLTVLGHTVKGEQQWYALICVVLVAATWVSLNLVNSPIGRALIAMKGSEVTAQVSGIDVSRYKLMIFVISAVYASLAGSLFGHYMEFITPSEADLLYSFEMLIVVLLGGMGSIFGAILAAAILISMPHLLSQFHDYEMLIFGLVLVFVMMFLPRGIVPTILDKFRGRAARAARS